jgi:hypothetical protein
MALEALRLIFGNSHANQRADKAAYDASGTDARKRSDHRPGGD